MCFAFSCAGRHTYKKERQCKDMIASLKAYLFEGLTNLLHYSQADAVMAKFDGDGDGKLDYQV